MTRRVSRCFHSVYEYYNGLAHSRLLGWSNIKMVTPPGLVIKNVTGKGGGWILP